jgi:hypothetical protein
MVPHPLDPRHVDSESVFSVTSEPCQHLEHLGNRASWTEPLALDAQESRIAGPPRQDIDIAQPRRSTKLAHRHIRSCIPAGTPTFRCDLLGECFSSLTRSLSQITSHLSSGDELLLEPALVKAVEKVRETGLTLADTYDYS